MGPRKSPSTSGRSRSWPDSLADKTLGEGKGRIRLKVKYQACNDKACLAPATLEVPVDVDVRKRP